MDDEKKKVKQAIALEYDPSDEAPRVVASGKGILADKIIEKARESSVPIHRDDKLADTLSRLDIGEMIPPNTWYTPRNCPVFSIAITSLIFSTTQTKEWSRLGLAQTEQTSSSHILWQTLQYFTSRRRATKAAAKFSV